MEIDKKPEMNLKDAWESYAKKCIPKDAGFNQIKQTRVAFYAGVTALFMMQMVVAGWSDVQAEVFMKAIDAEINEFLMEMVPKVQPSNETN